MSLKSKLLSFLSFIDENKSEIKLSNEELRQKLKLIYETKDFSDIDFIVGQNCDQIKAHKLVLSLNDCQLIKDKNSIQVKDVTKESFETLMSSFYQQNEIQLTEDNVNDLKRLAQTLGSEKLLNKCLVFEAELKLNKCFESIQPIVGHKSIEPIDGNQSTGMGANSSINKWISIPELKPSSSSTPKKRKLSISDFTDNNEDTTRALEIDLNFEQLDDISINSNNTENKSIDENDVNIDCVKNDELMTDSFDYDLENSVRIHKLSIDDKKESNIRVWKSAFKPKLDSSEEHIIATCGGKTAALIDCHKSTEHPVVFDTEDEEQLFCNAWTVLVLDNNKDKKCAVLAIGGQSGIYLFRDPDSVLEPYRLIKGNEDAVVCLVFHSQKPNWLLSASYDRSVTIHDIGSLYLKDDHQIEAKQHSIIYKYVTSMTLLTICYSFKNDCLIASGESNYLLFFKDISTFA